MEGRGGNILYFEGKGNVSHARRRVNSVTILSLKTQRKRGGIP